MLPAGVALFSRAGAFFAVPSSRLLCFSSFSTGILGSEESSSEIGLTSRSSLVGLRGRNPGGMFLFFHGVELVLDMKTALVSDLGTGVVFAEAGY